MYVNFDYLIYHAVIGSTPKKFGQYINEKKKKMRGGQKMSNRELKKIARRAIAKTLGLTAAAKMAESEVNE